MPVTGHMQQTANSKARQQQDKNELSNCQQLTRPFSIIFSKRDLHVTSAAFSFWVNSTLMCKESAWFVSMAAAHCCFAFRRTWQKKQSFLVWRSVLQLLLATPQIENNGLEQLPAHFHDRVFRHEGQKSGNARCEEPGRQIGKLGNPGPKS